MTTKPAPTAPESTNVTQTTTRRLGLVSRATETFPHAADADRALKFALLRHDVTAAVWS